MADFIGDAKSAVSSALRDSVCGTGDLDADYLMSAIEALDRAREYLNYNVGLVHITGMLGARVNHSK